MTFEGEVLNQTAAVAIAHKIDMPALLAVVEVESAGKSMDGAYPCLLFERHVFYRELKKAKKQAALDEAYMRGLAHPDWRPPRTPNSQYRDQGTSAKRVALYERAAAIDRECATRAASWGVGQTMGFNAELNGFPNAVAMLDYMKRGGVPAQVECMTREVERRHLVTKLNRHDWAGFAKAYNGAGYKANHYDTKMAAAYTHWSHQSIPILQSKPSPPLPPPGPKPPPPKGKEVVIASGAAAGTAGMALWQHLNWIQIGVAVAAVAMIAVTIWWIVRSKMQEPQLGTLAGVRDD